MSTNRQACTLTVLGVGITVGLGLLIGGSLVGHSWWALFSIIPAFLGLLCLFAISVTIDSSSSFGWFRFDGWVFLLIICITSTIGPPIILWHVLLLPSLTLILYISGFIAICWILHCISFSES